MSSDDDYEDDEEDEYEDDEERRPRCEFIDDAAVEASGDETEASSSEPEY